MSENISVLHVGDNPGSGAEAATHLERQDDRFTVETVTSPTEGMDRLAADDIDCVISQYDLPDEDGIEFLDTVREAYPDLPFILVTDDGSEAVASDAISAGATDYVRKDEDVDQYDALADRIREAVRQRERIREHRRKSSLLDDVFEQAPIHLYVKDEEARYVRQTHHVGSNPEEERGKTFPEITPGEFSESVHEEELEVIETGEPILNKEEKYPRGDLWILRSQVPWRDDDGNIQGLIGVSYHITERKEYEQELERKNERLEEFASIVSHDLRNPLNIAKGRLGLAQAECDSQHLDAIENVFDRMEALIDDLLTLTSKGDVIDEMEPIDVADLIHDCWRNVETANADLVVDTSRVIRGDWDRCQQLLMNLIRNAIEHGGEDVTINVGELEDGFYVEDDGTGIPEEHWTNVFDASYSTSDDGGGFGLSIVKEIVHAHDWEIEVTDGIDGGARFEITGIEFVEW